MELFDDPEFWATFIVNAKSQVLLVAEYAAKAIVVALSLSILAVIVSRSPWSALKRRTVAFAWIALPSAPLLASQALLYPNHVLPGGLTGATIFLWTIVFAALGIGVRLRGCLKGATKSFDAPSLSLAVLVFSVVVGCCAVLFFKYGLFPQSAEEACSNEKVVPLSYCGLVELDGIYLSIFGIVILILGGIGLPWESPLIRACSTYRYAADIRQLIASAVAFVVIGVFTWQLRNFDPTWRDQRFLNFAIIAIFFILLSAALLFTIRRMQRFEQLPPNGNCSPFNQPPVSIAVGPVQSVPVSSLGLTPPFSIK
jgi:hypothetical protein